MSQNKNKSSGRSQSPLDEHRSDIEGLIKRGASDGEIKTHLSLKGIPTSTRSINRARARYGYSAMSDKNPTIDPIETPGSSIHGDDATVISEPVEDLKSPEDIVTERGLSLDEWDIYDVVINEWDGMRPDDKGTRKLRQLKIRLRRIVKIEVIAPARLPGKKFVLPKRRLKPSKRTVVFVGDQQAPLYDHKVHKTFLQFLDIHKPDEGVLMGDTGDFADISRHPSNPENDATMQESVDGSYVCMYEYRESSPETSWQKLPGNHDIRVRRAAIDRFREAYGVRQAKLPDEAESHPVLSIEHLFRLDELGIEYIDPKGDYEHAEIQVSSKLAARHGWLAKQGSGTSALASLNKLGYSIVVGHTHRQSLVFKTHHLMDKSVVTLAACETGCMAQIPGGLGYAVAPDWQNGWAVAEVWEDGTFRLDLATYVDGAVYFRNERYKG